MNADYKSRSRQNIVRRQTQCQFAPVNEVEQIDIPEPLPIMKNGSVVMGGSNSSGRNKKKGSYTYTLQSIKKITRKLYKYYGRIHCNRGRVSAGRSFEHVRF